MVTPLESLRARIRSRAGREIAKGEVWLGSDLFAGAAQDTVDNHLRLADQLNHALVCFSVLTPGTVKPDLGYRYFNLSDLEQAAKSWDGPVLAVVDGPFQEMVNTLGLMDVLTLWMGDWEAVASHYRTFAETVRNLVDRISDLPVAGVVFADDLSADTGPMVSPDSLDTLCTPFYSKIVAKLKARNKAVLLHSCGRLDPLIPLMNSWQMDGLAAIQSRINSFETLFARFSHEMFIIGGIEADLLEARQPDHDGLGWLKDLVRAGHGGNLVLGSSCGLFRADFLKRVKTLYAMADA